MIHPFARRFGKATPPSSGAPAAPAAPHPFGRGNGVRASALAHLVGLREFGLRTVSRGSEKVASALRAVKDKVRPAATKPPRPFALLLAEATPPVDIEAVKREAFAAGVRAGREEIRERCHAFLSLGTKAGDPLMALILAIHGQCTAEDLQKRLDWFNEARLLDRAEGRRWGALH